MTGDSWKDRPAEQSRSTPGAEPPVLEGRLVLSQIGGGNVAAPPAPAVEGTELGR